MAVVLNFKSEVHFCETKLYDGTLPMPQRDSKAETEAFNKAFGLRLEAARIALGLSRADMLTLLECKDAGYAQYIHGYNLTPPRKLEPLVKRGVSCDWLFFGITTALPLHMVGPLETAVQAASESLTSRRKEG
ncbi:hypothetical protein [Azospirillum brasilense]|uniref:hypothetical protein n=1 Tax=Azospirillum brasilense TaxID=192 RepID=UPI0010C14B02|nr:hypothetical protein [Azospirillum brasilense]